MKNKKGSTIVWAVTLIMLLMVIVGASLSLAYVHYNQSIKNHNKTQVELIANSAIKTLTSVIEKGENNEQLVPENINDTINVYKMELNQPFGKISDITITRKKTNLLIASLKATYSEETYTVYAYMTQSKGAWTTKLYDTKGNRNIKVSDSSGDSGNTGGDSGGTGGNTGGDSNIGIPSGSSVADTLDKSLTIMFDQYYTADIVNSIYSFRDWYEKQCKFMNHPYTGSNYPDEWWFSDPYWLKQAYFNAMTSDYKFSKLEDDLFQKAKLYNSEISSKNELYVGFHSFAIKDLNKKSRDYYIIASDRNTHDADNSTYMIYMNKSWYVLKKSGYVQGTIYSSLDEVKNDLKDTNKWQKLE